MPILCHNCKSWNCEENGDAQNRMCYQIVKDDLMNKGLPEDIAYNIARTYKYEEELSYFEPIDIEAKEYSKCIECNIDKRKNAYHWCYECYKKCYKKQPKKTGFMFIDDE